MATDNQFMAVGAKGVVHNNEAVQVIIGPDVTNVREEVDDLMENGGWEEFNNQISNDTPVAEKENETEFATNESQLFAPVDGKFINIEELKDDVFSQKMLGDGYAIEPSNGDIYANVEGTIESVFPTKHAIGIKSLSGAEILLHLGLDTVELKGKPFDILVKEGDSVKEDTKIATMNIDEVRKSGKDPVVITVVTNSDQYKLNKFKENSGSKVKHGNSIVLVYKG
ncbi:glucose PTS transporter subunit IIA [Companilactobacillus huachuanensis]|uniref:Glucose PTS transporter subunit IIA n=1 Tax=Companilactobacillus huachuanensis TaxID=2559914 RepID=A0ABW1RQP5_9LACO|nr:PTS glucose transporter subunit IIA [Companilactobacillus huachuanensis]